MLQQHQDSRTTFDPFWEAFPRKSCKGAAWQLWDRMKLEDRELALQAVKTYRRVFDAAEPENRSYLFSILRWLRDECWHDDPGEWWRLAKAHYEVKCEWRTQVDGTEIVRIPCWYVWEGKHRRGPYRTRADAEKGSGG